MTLIATLIDQIKQTTPPEWVAVAASVAEVLLAKANKVWLYPMGIISTGIYIYLMFVSGLYAECVLNVYYLVMSIYGWVLWYKPTATGVLRITVCTAKQTAIAWGIAVVGTTLFYVVLRFYTPSVVPFWDAIVTGTAWAGMWLLAKRKLENWVWLNASNIIAIPLLFYKHLPLTALLTAFLFIIAVWGYYSWKREMVKGYL